MPEVAWGGSFVATGCSCSLPRRVSGKRQQCLHSSGPVEAAGYGCWTFSLIAWRVLLVHQNGYQEVELQDELQPEVPGALN